MSRPLDNWVGVALAALAGVCYGSCIVIARRGYAEGLDAFAITAVRFVLLWLVLAGVLRLLGRPRAVPARMRLGAWGVGALTIVTTGAYLAAVAYVPVSLATLVFYTNPLMTLLLCALVGRVRTDGVELLVMVVALGGLALALGASLQGIDPVGIGLAVLASLGAASVYLCSSGALERVEPLVYTLHLAVGGALVAVGICLLPGLGRWPVSPLGWQLLALTSVIYVVAVIAMFVAVRLLGPVATPMVLNLEPVTALVLAMLVLGEHMAATQWLGAALVVGAILAAQARRARQASAGKEKLLG